MLMNEWLHKMLYTGIGLAALTEQKAKEMVDELVKKGEVSSEEGKHLAQELIDKARHHTEEFQRVVHDEVNKAMTRCNLVTREEYDALRAELEELKARTGQSEKASEGM